MKSPYIIINNFFDDSTCDAIRKFAVYNMPLLTAATDINPYFNNVTLHVNDIQDAAIQCAMLSGVSKTRKLIEAFYNAQRQYLDHTTVTMWPTGHEMGAHADNIYWNTMEKNYVPHRTYSAIIYLNDDYVGGEFCWHDIIGKITVITEKLSPKKGTLIAFGAGIEYIHSVERVIDGTRWTQPIWFTDDFSKAAPIYQTEKYTSL